MASLHCISHVGKVRWQTNIHVSFVSIRFCVHPTRAFRCWFDLGHTTETTKTHPCIHTTLDDCFTTISQRPCPSSSSVRLPLLSSPGPGPIYRRGLHTFVYAILVGYGPLWPLHEPNGLTTNGSPNGTDGRVSGSRRGFCMRFSVFLCGRRRMSRM